MTLQQPFIGLTPAPANGYPRGRDWPRASRSSPVAGDWLRASPSSPPAGDWLRASRSSPPADDWLRASSSSPPADDRIRSSRSSPPADHWLRASLSSPVGGDPPDASPSSALGSGTPPASGSSPVAGAIARHKLLVCGCALLLALLGAAAGFARKGTYTAASTLQVGKVNPNSPGFYGFVQSASDLATAFSRAVTAGPVLQTVHHKLGLSAEQAVGSLAAEPIPNSPAFRVIATGPSAPAAIALANVASDALMSYEAHTNTYSPESARLLGAYQAASLDLVHSERAVDAAAGEYAKHHDDAVALTKLENAQAARAADTLRAQALAGGYQQSAQSATTRDLISPLSGAVSAVSDRKSKIEFLAFMGLLGGMVIGCGLAVLVDGRKRAWRVGRSRGDG